MTLNDLIISSQYYAGARQEEISYVDTSQFLIRYEGAKPDYLGTVSFGLSLYFSLVI